MSVVRMTEQGVGEMIEAVAAKQPAPGGGAVAAMAGALAAALGRMVSAYSLGKDGSETVAGIAEELTAAQSRLLDLADEDAAAYSRLRELTGLSADDPQRAGLGLAASAAAGVPLEVVRQAAGTLRLAEDLAPLSSVWMRSDLAITAILAEAAARSAVWMVETNLPAVREHTGKAEADTLRAACEVEIAAAPARLARVLRACAPAA